jgi:hypothetical protein
MGPVPTTKSTKLGREMDTETIMLVKPDMLRKNRGRELHLAR